MPFYHKTEGQPSNSLHVQTLADVPSAPPGNVRADVLNATAVELKWAPPPPQVLLVILGLGMQGLYAPSKT